MSNKNTAPETFTVIAYRNPGRFEEICFCYTLEAAQRAAAEHEAMFMPRAMEIRDSADRQCPLRAS